MGSRRRVSRRLFLCSVGRLARRRGWRPATRAFKAQVKNFNPPGRMPDSTAGETPAATALGLSLSTTPRFCLSLLTADRQK